MLRTLLPVVLATSLLAPAPVLAPAPPGAAPGAVPSVASAPATPAATWAARMAAAPTRAGRTGATAGGWRPPVAPVRIVRAFAPPVHDWLPGHRGADLAAHEGQTVRAAGAGRVTFAGTLAGRGVVVVDHGELRTTYLPVAAGVVVGQRIAAGAVLGAVATGTGHCGDGSCLHLGLRRGATYLDPRLILGKARTRLLPW